MKTIEDAKALRPEELISRSDSELLQLKLFYEKKIEDEKKFDIFKKPKSWFRNNRAKALHIFLGGMVTLVVSLYFGFTMNMFYSIPAIIVFTLFLFIGILFENTKIETYHKNVDTLSLLLNTRAELKDMKKSRPLISKKALAVVDILKQGEANQTVLLKKLKEKNISLSEKTLRKYLNEDLKEIVAYNETSFDSTSRHQSNTKVYCIKMGN